MKPLWLVGLTVPLMVGADSPEPNILKEEIKRLQGTWVHVASEIRGERTKATERVELVITHDRIVLKAKDFGDESKYRIDPTKEPKELDLIYTGKRNPERKGVAKCIYRLSGNELTICGNALGAPNRPREFKTREKDGLSMEVYRREKNGKK